jgi:hypothetical protein
MQIHLPFLYYFGGNMSDNLELEALTRSLNSIVSNIQDLIAKSKAPSLIAE